MISPGVVVDEGVVVPDDAFVGANTVIRRGCRIAAEGMQVNWNREFPDRSDYWKERGQ